MKLRLLIFSILHFDEPPPHTYIMGYKNEKHVGMWLNRGRIKS